jgi:hypothetical protein
MTVSIVSAEPLKLIRYLQGAQHVNTHLHNEASRLAHALTQFSAGCTEYSIGVDGRLADALRGHVARTAPNDQWVGQVAQQFMSSDRAVPLGVMGPGGPQLADRMHSEAREIMLQAARDVIREQIRAAADWLIWRPARRALSFGGAIARTLGSIGRQAFDFAVSAPRQLASAALSGARQVAASAWEGLTGLARGVWSFVKGAAQRVAQLLGWLRRAFANTLRVLGAGGQQLWNVARAMAHGFVAGARAYLTHAVGFLKGFWEGTWDFVTGTGTLLLDLGKLAIGDRETWAKYGQIIDAFRTNPLGTLKTLGEAIVAPIVDDWKHGRYGEVVGRVTFEALPAILAVFTGGGSAAAYATKASKVGTAAKALEKAGDVARAVEKLGEVGRAAGKLGTAARIGAKAADFLKDAVKHAVARRVERITSVARHVRDIARMSGEAITTVARGGFRELSAKIRTAVRDRLVRAVSKLKDIEIYIPHDRLYSGVPPIHVRRRRGGQASSGNQKASVRETARRGEEGSRGPRRREYINRNPRATVNEIRVGRTLNSLAARGRIHGVSRVEGWPEIKGAKSPDYRFFDSQGKATIADLYEPETNELIGSPHNMARKIIEEKGGQTEVVVIELRDHFTKIGPEEAREGAELIFKTDNHGIKRVIFIKHDKIMIDAVKR